MIEAIERCEMTSYFVQDHTKNFWTHVLMLIVLCLASCGGGGSSSSASTSPTDPYAGTTCPISTPKTTPSFSADILPALQLSCGSNTSSCHGGTSPAGRIVFSGAASSVYSQLRAVTQSGPPWFRVNPGSPDTSWLIEKITKDNPGLTAFGQTYGTRMPQGSPNVCQPTVDTLRAWITNGALNN